eukprot:TRINITY_DN22708_c0_g1_i1.p1 TRINITY_DN22708_c0_g1~~TRINITY_DN22708_c0_g1_i1.p1  ORF type:complete len:448 (+),score=128.08 TRINITY_DN22708_c0_g1_i1:160-1503(+)
MKFQPPRVQAEASTPYLQDMISMSLGGSGHVRAGELLALAREDTSMVRELQHQPQPQHPVRLPQLDAHGSVVRGAPPGLAASLSLHRPKEKGGSYTVSTKLVVEHAKRLRAGTRRGPPAPAPHPKTRRRKGKQANGEDSPADKRGKKRTRVHTHQDGTGDAGKLTPSLQTKGSSPTDLQWSFGRSSPAVRELHGEAPRLSAVSAAPLPRLGDAGKANKVSMTPAEEELCRGAGQRGRAKLTASAHRWQAHREALLRISDESPRHRGGITRAVEEFDRHIHLLASQAAYRPIVVKHTSSDTPSAATADAGTSTDGTDGGSLAFDIDSVPLLRALLIGGSRTGLAGLGLDASTSVSETDSTFSDDDNPYQSLSLQSYLPVEKTDVQKRTEQLEMLSKLLLWAIHDRDGKVSTLTQEGRVASEAQVALAAENAELTAQLAECREELAGKK